MKTSKSWMEVATDAQAQVIESERIEPTAPIDAQRTNRAILNIRQDMVLVVTLLAGLNEEAGAINRKLSWALIAGFLNAAMLIVIALRL